MNLAKRIGLVCVVSAIGMLVLSTPSEAKNIYVRGGSTAEGNLLPGMSRGSGSMEKPFARIFDALAEAVSGDVIHVAQGTYYGKGGGGLWKIPVPNLTLAGGYNNDFTERNPWKYQVILRRGCNAKFNLDECVRLGHTHDTTPTKATWNPGGMIDSVNTDDASNLVFDGFILDGHTRQSYKANGDMILGEGNGDALFRILNPGVKIRNCAFVNGYFGVRLKVDGDAEVSNCVFLNLIDRAIDFMIGTGKGIIKNNTTSFIWQSSVVEGYGLAIGREVNLDVANNLFMFSNQVGVNNGFQNTKVKMTNNVFFSNQAGQYQYWDKATGATMIVDNVGDDMNGDAAKSVNLTKSSTGNRVEDPKIGDQIDKVYFDRYSNQLQSTGGGKVNMDVMNQWRSMAGLPLQGSRGSGRVNFAPVYPLDHAMIFSAALSGIGAQKDGPFAVYTSAEVAAIAKQYAKADIGAILARATSKTFDGQNLSFSGFYQGPEASDFGIEDKGITKDKYNAYRVRAAQELVSGAAPFMVVYVLKGSKTERNFKEEFKCYARGEAKADDAITISGTAYLKGTVATPKLYFVVDAADKTGE